MCIVELQSLYILPNSGNGYAHQKELHTVAFIAIIAYWGPLHTGKQQGLHAIINNKTIKLMYYTKKNIKQW